MNGKELRHLERALMAAFPNESDLARLVRYHLDTRLEEITQAPSQRAKVFELLSWAETRNRLDDLLTGAREENPDNPALQALGPAPDVTGATVLKGEIFEGQLTLYEPNVAAIAAGNSEEPADMYSCGMHLTL